MVRRVDAVDPRLVETVELDDPVLPADPPEVRRPVDVYRRRRRTAVAVVAVVAATVVVSAVTASPSRPVLVESSNDAAGVELVASVLDEAWAGFSTSGVLPTSVPEPLLVASDGSGTLIVSDGSSGVCVFGGIVDGAPPVVQSDPSGRACTVEAMAELAEVLASPVPAAPPGVLVETVESALLYAGSGVSGGVSFAGFSHPTVEVLVAPDGGSMVAGVDGWCVTVSTADVLAGSPPAPVRCSG